MVFCVPTLAVSKSSVAPVTVSDPSSPVTVGAVVAIRLPSLRELDRENVESPRES